MCGRYTLTVELLEILNRFDCEADFDFSPRYNAAPRQIMPVVTWSNGRRKLELMQWGLIPHWAKDKSIANKLINARIETLRQKPAFRESSQFRRCLVPADGYYEWSKTETSKQPHRIVAKEAKLIAFAGVWDRWVDQETGELLKTFAIVTTVPAGSIKRIHERMPLILAEAWENNWLKAPASPANLVKSGGVRRDLHAYPVSPLVNSPDNDFPAVAAAHEKSPSLKRIGKPQ